MTDTSLVEVVLRNALNEMRELLQEMRPGLRDTRQPLNQDAEITMKRAFVFLETVVILIMEMMQLSWMTLEVGLFLLFYRVVLIIVLCLVNIDTAILLFHLLDCDWSFATKTPILLDDS